MIMAGEAARGLQPPSSEEREKEKKNGKRNEGVGAEVEKTKFTKKKKKGQEKEEEKHRSTKEEKKEKVNTQRQLKWQLNLQVDEANQGHRKRMEGWTEAGIDRRGGLRVSRSFTDQLWKNPPTKAQARRVCNAFCPGITTSQTQAQTLRRPEDENENTVTHRDLLFRGQSSPVHPVVL